MVEFKGKNPDKYFSGDCFPISNPLKLYVQHYLHYMGMKRNTSEDIFKISFSTSVVKKNKKIKIKK